jgi:hypothetical protein
MSIYINKTSLKAFLHPTKTKVQRKIKAQDQEIITADRDPSDEFRSFE